MNQLASIQEAKLETEVIGALTERQKIGFMAEMDTKRKKTPTAILLTLLLGGIGAHYYYYGNIWVGVICTVFCWTWIPVLWSLIDLFLAPKYVKETNTRNAKVIALRMATLYPEEPKKD